MHVKCVRVGTECIEIIILHEKKNEEEIKITIASNMQNIHNMKSMEMVNLCRRHSVVAARLESDDDDGGANGIIESRGFGPNQSAYVNHTNAHIHFS